MKNSLLYSPSRFLLFQEIHRFAADFILPSSNAAKKQKILYVCSQGEIYSYLAAHFLSRESSDIIYHYTSNLAVINLYDDFLNKDVIVMSTETCLRYFVDTETSSTLYPKFKIQDFGLVVLDDLNDLEEISSKYSTLIPMLLNIPILGVTCSVIEESEQTVDNSVYRFKGLCEKLQIKDFLMTSIEFEEKIRYISYVLDESEKSLKDNLKQIFTQIESQTLHYLKFTNKLTEKLSLFDNFAKSSFEYESLLQLLFRYAKNRDNILQFFIEKLALLHEATKLVAFLHPKEILLKLKDKFTLDSKLRLETKEVTEQIYYANALNTFTIWFDALQNNSIFKSLCNSWTKNSINPFISASVSEILKQKANAKIAIVIHDSLIPYYSSIGGIFASIEQVNQLNSNLVAISRSQYTKLCKLTSQEVQFDFVMQSDAESRAYITSEGSNSVLFVFYQSESWNELELEKQLKKIENAKLIFKQVNSKKRIIKEEQIEFTVSTPLEQISPMKKVKTEDSLNAQHTNETTTPLALINIISSKLKLAPPKLNVILLKTDKSTNTNLFEGTIACTLEGKLIQTSATGLNKQEAKQNAAKKLLHIFKEINVLLDPKLQGIDLSCMDQ